MVTVNGLAKLQTIRPANGAMTEVRVLVGGTAAPPPTGTGTYNDTELRGLIENAKSRSTHTGTQLAATISDFLEAVQDAVAAMFGGSHSGVTFTYNDTTGTLTATASGDGTGSLDVEAAQDLVAAQFAGTHNGVTFVYDDTTGTITATVAISISQVDGLQVALDGLVATDLAHDDRLAEIQAALDALGPSGTGTNGAAPYTWGDPSTTDAAVTAYSPYLILGASELMAPAGAMLVGALGSGDTTVVLETATTMTGPWTAVTGGSITIAAGQRRGFTTTTTGVLASLASESLIRASCTAAPAGSGGTMTWRTPVTAGGGATAAVESLTFAANASQAAGDLRVAVLFLNSGGTVSWPTGWTAYGTPFPAGLDTAGGGPFYMHVATRTATASEPSTTVSFGSATAVLTALSVSNGALATPTSANVSVISTAATTGQTPASLSTTVADSIVVHLAMPRWTQGNAPSTIAWDGSPTTTTQAQTNRPPGTTSSGSPNTGIVVGQFPQATAGAITRRTASWTNQARALTATLVLKPSSGSTAKGLQIQANIRAA